jgi:hypothetical protein
MKVWGKAGPTSVMRATNKFLQAGHDLAIEMYILLGGVNVEPQ